MDIEEEVRNYLRGQPRKIDLDLILDPSMLCGFHFEQLRRWRENPGMSLSKDIDSLTLRNALNGRRKALIRQIKEGTDVRRDAEDQEEDQA